MMDLEMVDDVDQHTVYAAEARVDQSPNHYFSNFASCEALVEAIVQSPYWQRRGGEMAAVQPVFCYRQRSDSASRGGLYHAGWGIRLNRQHWNTLLICHELAHVMTAWRHQHPKGHAYEFRTEYLSLVRYVAPELASQLVRHFNDAGLGVGHDPTGWDVPVFDFPIVERSDSGAIAL